MDATQQKEAIGTVAGAGLGFLVGGPIGALVGGALGYFGGQHYAKANPPADHGWKGATTYVDIHGRTWNRDLATDVPGQGGLAPVGFSDWNRGGSTADVRVSGVDSATVGKALDDA